MIIIINININNSKIDHIGFKEYLLFILYTLLNTNKSLLILISNYILFYLIVLGLELDLGLGTS